MSSDASKAAALSGVTVLDLSAVGPAARCTRILADYGAALVKIASPRSAAVQPAFWAYAAGRGTRRALLDLKLPAGRDAFLRLAARADVVVESFRPGVALRLGIGYEAVREANERIVYCSTSGYGQTGARAAWAGHDLDYLAVGGFLHASGRRADGSPALPGATLADAAAGGMHAALAIFAALLRRERTGHGEFLDVAVADGVLSLMALHIDEHLATDAQPGPGSDLLTGRFACYDVYPARDGGFLAVAAIEPAFWANLCRALGLERWIPHQRDDARQDEIRAELRRVFASRDRDEWAAQLAPADTCVAPVLSVAEVAADPHFAARGAFVEATHPGRGRLRQLGFVLAGQSPAASASKLPDGETTDTDALLRGAGYADDEIAKLRREGAVA